MWTKGRTHFMLLGIRHQSFRFILPVPLFIFQDLLWSLSDLVELGTRAFPRQKLPGIIMRSLMNILQELRQMGPWQLMAVSFGDSRISIDFK